MGFEIDEEAEHAFVRQLAEGMHEFGMEAAGEVYSRAPKKTGRYKKTIQATTYQEEEVIGGRAISNRERLGKAEIVTVVFTSSAKGHLLERGTQPHDVSRKDAVLDIRARGRPRTIQHPGSRPFPHFGPGAMAAIGKAAAAVAKKVK